MSSAAASGAPLTTVTDETSLSSTTLSSSSRKRRAGPPVTKEVCQSCRQLLISTRRFDDSRRYYLSQHELLYGVEEPANTSPKHTQYLEWVRTQLDRDATFQDEEGMDIEGVGDGSSPMLRLNDLVLRDYTVIHDECKHIVSIDDIEPMKEVLALYLANGITTIRGMLGHPRHLELRRKINSGEIF